MLPRALIAAARLEGEPSSVRSPQWRRTSHSGWDGSSASWVSERIRNLIGFVKVGRGRFVGFDCGGGGEVDLGRLSVWGGIARNLC